MPSIRKHKSRQESDTGTGGPEGYLPIGHTAKLLGLKQHVMRYWESKFDVLKPTISNKTRMYNADDIRLFSALQVMLHEKGMTMNAAQSMIETEGLEAVLKLGKVDDSEAFAKNFTPLPLMLDLDHATEGTPVTASKTPNRPRKAVKNKDTEKAHTEEAGEALRTITVSLGRQRFVLGVDRLRSLSKSRQHHLFRIRDRLINKTVPFDLAS